jgi:hypothetical protein
MFGRGKEHWARDLGKALKELEWNGILEAGWNLHSECGRGIASYTLRSNFVKHSGPRVQGL